MVMSHATMTLSYFQIVSPSLFRGTSLWKLMFFFASIYLYNPWYRRLLPLLTPVSVSVSPEHILSHPHKGHCGTQAIALRVKCAGTPSMVRSSVAELPLRWQCRYRLQPTFQHLPIFGFVTEDRWWIKRWSCSITVKIKITQFDSVFPFCKLQLWPLLIYWHSFVQI